MIKGIHHLGFTVRDAEASAAWYVEVLGFRRAGEHQAPDGAFRKVFLRHDNLPSRIGLTEHRAAAALWIRRYLAPGGTTPAKRAGSRSARMGARRTSRKWPSGPRGGTA